MEIVWLNVHAALRIIDIHIQKTRREKANEIGRKGGAIMNRPYNEHRGEATG